MGLVPGGPAPDGCLFHWATATEDGIRITDVWEPAELFERFAEEKIGPASAAVGIEGPPTTTFYDVYNSYLPGARAEAGAA